MLTHVLAGLDGELARDLRDGDAAVLQGAGEQQRVVVDGLGAIGDKRSPHTLQAADQPEHPPATHTRSRDPQNQGKTALVMTAPLIAKSDVAGSTPTELLEKSRSGSPDFPLAGRAVEADACVAPVCRLCVAGSSFDVRAVAGNGDGESAFAFDLVCLTIEW